MSTLDLAVIGNCSFSALIDKKGKIVWGCYPHFEGDPVFCSLINGQKGKTSEECDSSPWGFYDVELLNFDRSEQHYIENTAIVETLLYDKNGAALKITDFAPRYSHYGRYYKPTTIVRLLEPVAGTPRIRIRLRPRSNYGAKKPDITLGSNHIRYVGDVITLRLMTDASLLSIRDEIDFALTSPKTLILGPDESLHNSIKDEGQRLFESTKHHWLEFTRRLSIPFEWQDAVIRAAITLKLCTFEETGAVLAALTTSIPEAPNTVRNWDYRFCWLRDSYFVIHTLNRLGATSTMEGYLSYVMNLTFGDSHDHLQPLFGIDYRREIEEIELDSLSGYRGMKPVRIGNKAYQQSQNDVFGAVVLATMQAFFDQRLERRGTLDDFRALEILGYKAMAFFDKPDAGLWELREKARIHTFSAIMCWVTCDRLSKIARRLGLSNEEQAWNERAVTIKEEIGRRAWNERLNSFVESFDADSEESIDASLLLMHELGFIEPADPRFVGTVAAVEKRLKQDEMLYRYILEDDFGHPETAFTICTFWYIDALHAIGRVDEARELFEKMLAKRNHVGLLSEDMDFKTGEMWGNFPQTYSLVGLIKSAIRLSEPWNNIT